MKNLMLISAILLIAGCGKGGQVAKETPKGTPSKSDGNNGTASKPVNKPTKEDVVGSYEANEEAGDTFKLVLLDNGRFEIHFAGKKAEEGTWKFEAKEVHILGDGKEVTSVLKIESNGDLTEIANIGEERTELPFRKDRAFKRIK